MEIISNLTNKDIFLLITGVITGGIISYIVSLIVVAQTDKKKRLVVELIGREIKLDDREYYPYQMVDIETREILENCYCIYLRIWNKGNLEIKQSDIDPNNALKISIDSSARVIGHPRKSFENQYVDLTVTEIESNIYQINFNCFNPREGVELDFYITGNPYALLNAEGRMYGGEIVLATDDDLLTIYERFQALVLFILTISIFIFLIVGILGIVWLWISNFTFKQLIGEPQLIPYTIKFFIYSGLISTLFLIMFELRLLIDRKQAPKDYIVKKDRQINILDRIIIYWFAAIKGRRSIVKKAIIDNLE